MPGWPGRSRHLRGRWRMKWPASGQLPGRDPNGGYARRRLGGSASDVGSIPTASTIAGPSAKPVPNGRFAEGLCFARVLRGFRDLRRSGASSENAGDASSQGRKRPLALLFLRSFRTCVRNGESPFSRCRSEGRPPVTDLVLPENDDGADTLPSKKDDANAVQSSSSGLYSPNASCSVAEPSSPAA